MTLCMKVGLQKRLPKLERHGGARFGSSATLSHFTSSPCDSCLCRRTGVSIDNSNGVALIFLAALPVTWSRLKQPLLNVFSKHSGASPARGERKQKANCLSLYSTSLSLFL